MGLETQIKTAANSEDPQQSVLDLLSQETPEELPPVANIESEVPRATQIFALQMAQMKNIEAIHAYGMTMDQLVKRVASGNDGALFKAVRIDPVAAACDTLAHRISVAVATSDNDFLSKLKNAHSGPPKKSRDTYGPLRYFLLLLDDEGVLEKLTRSELCTLLCEQLELYPYDDSDAERSLYQFVRRWKNQRVT